MTGAHGCIRLLQRLLENFRNKMLFFKMVPRDKLERKEKPRAQGRKENQAKVPQDWWQQEGGRMLMDRGGVSESWVFGA